MKSYSNLIRAIVVSEDVSIALEYTCLLSGYMPEGSNVVIELRASSIVASIVECSHVIFSNDIFFLVLKILRSLLNEETHKQYLEESWNDTKCNQNIPIPSKDRN